MQKQKTYEEIYQKKTPLEHILLRPDTYIGTVEPTKQQKWILPKNQIRFTYKEITYTPGFYKIFDEVLVNAADNYQRDKKMNQLQVTIQPAQGFIRVRNNGKGIPVVIHQEHKIYIPELIFGHLLTGSNYNDDEKRTVGGRNGYGAKLANVFSDKFIVECGDSKNGKSFKMTWRNNMKTHDDAEIMPFNGKDFVEVTFFPCFKLLNMPNKLDEDIISLLSKRVYDMAGILPKVRVSLNNKEIDIKSFSEYVDMYFEKEASPVKIFDKEINNERWEVIVSISEGEFRQVSFVNAVCTSKGGTHVNYVVDQIVDKVQDKIKKKEKDLNIKPFQIKAHIWIFLNCLIENPTFDTQTKETMTLKASQFGSKCDLSEKIIKDFLKLGIVDTVIGIAKAKEMGKLAKLTGGQKKSKLTGIPKLEDANEAGTKNSEKCTLILTEGDSAKALAMSGLAVIGRDYYGVFPLKGKLLNVRDTATKNLATNEEIQNLMKIVGLQIGKKYEDLKSLRYGAIMIMSDQDTDGSHIKGLVINFIHHLWPTLFEITGFIKQFITPLLKVSKGSQKISFYTMNDFETWRQAIPDINKWTIKYYKGLGTSDDKEAREYFQDLRKHRIDFQYVDKQDDDSIDLIFNKKKAENRKNWLGQYDPKITIQYDRPRIRYKQFVDREFIHFSNEDNNRSIGSLIDGFKPGQRKILYGCFKRNLNKEIKVAQLAGYIAENSAYHHGEQSLVQTIVGMAQNYVGSNNINLLMPNGQFGSRNLGGKDHASARYIFTELNRVTRAIFPEPDDHTLTYVEDDGQVVEPQFYMPILPMVLVNGCQGIGTGWSTYIPNFNPREICQIIKNKLRTGEDFPIIHPWYKNYTGQIIPNQDGVSYTVNGNLYVDESKENTVIINELPIGKWTKDYKVNLDEIMGEGEDKLTGLREYHTKDKVHFEVEMNADYFQKMYNESDNYDLERLNKYFKMAGSISMRNMVGFNQEGKLQRMTNVKSILDMFFDIRKQYYGKRKDYLVSKLVRDLVELQEKERFIIEVVEEKIHIRNVKKAKLCELLRSKKYVKYSDLPKIKSTKVVKAKKQQKQDDENQEEENKEQQQQDEKESKMNKAEEEIKKLGTQYNYLLSMPLWNLTYEKVEEIKASRQKKQSQLDALEKTRIEDMWIDDIDELLRVLQIVQEQEKVFRAKEDEQMRKNFGKGKVQKAVKKKPRKEKPKGYNWDQDEDTEEETEIGVFGQKQKKKPTKQKEGVEQLQGIKIKKEGKNPKKQELKQEKEVKKETQKPKDKQPDDFMARIKKRMAEEPDTLLTTRPVATQMSMDEYLSGSKKERKYEFDVIPNPNKRKDEEKQNKRTKKKKMNFDSDEQEQEDQWSEYEDESFDGNDE